MMRLHVSGMPDNLKERNTLMALRWFDSHRSDEIDALFSKANSADLGLVWHFLAVCGIWGALSWFSGGGFGVGFEKGIPLAACLLIYEASIRQSVRSAELRARIIEIDGKVTVLEEAHAAEAENQELESIHQMLSHLHRRLKDHGDIGGKLVDIDATVKELRHGPEVDAFYQDMEIP